VHGIKVDSPHEQYLKRSAGKRLIQTSPDPNLTMVVVIPCYNEPDLLGTLQNLAQCDQPHGEVEIIIVINSSYSCVSTIKEQNQKSQDQVFKWLKSTSDNWLTIHLLHLPNLPKKSAGVGSARKIGMDEALRRLADSNQAEKGLLICYDADCRCAPNYFTSIETHFSTHPKSPGTSIYFEHPLNTDEMNNRGFGKLGQSISRDEFEGIAAYELHLRYHVRAQKYINFPYGFQTIGSAMAVQAWAYVKQGGMNRRQAGEDFYFLQKISWLGQITELSNTSVYPSPRISDRVPFGTGKAISRFIRSKEQTSYPLQAYLDIKWLIQQIETLWEDGHFQEKPPIPLSNFLGKKFLKDVIPEIRKNSTDRKKFRKRFFRWLNAFQLMKYLNRSKNEYYGSKKIEFEAQKLLTELGLREEIHNTAELLKQYRQLDCNFINSISTQTDNLKVKKLSAS
tara:strand:+ start:216 stop:1568 length:1353 start_codon:yes stop_codon:yes gene_type:complete